MHMNRLGCAFGVVLATLFANLQIAQGADAVGPGGVAFKTLPINPAWLAKDKSTAKEIDGKIKKILADGSISGSETMFDNYFNQVVFARWTQIDEKQLNELPKERDKFLKNIVEASGKHSTVHARLVDLTHAELSKVVADEGFHPAVRYNAILIIGQLNEVEPNRGSGTKQMPEPFIKALSTLLDELKKPGNNEAVRVGALLGVSRHLEWDNAKAAMSPTKIQAAVRKDIVDELMSIVNTKASPAGRSLEGQVWLRRRALEALGHANAQVTPAFAQLVEEIITDDAEPMSLRCTAAEVMSRVTYAAPALPKVDDMAKKLGYLGLFACHTELLRLEGLKKKDEELLRVSGGAAAGPGMGGMGGGMMPGGAGGMMPGGAGAGGMMPGGAGGMMPGGMPGGGAGAGGAGIPGAGGMMGGMMPGMAGGRKGGAGMAPGMPGMGGLKDTSNDPKAYRVDYSKRRLRAELYAVQLAMGKKKADKAEGLYVYAKAEPETTLLDKIKLQVEEVIKVVEEQTRNAEAYEKSLKKEMKKLEAITKTLPVAAKPEAAKADAAKGAGAVPGEEEPMGAKPAAAKPAAAKPAAEEPMEEVPTGPPAAKGPVEPAKGGAPAAPAGKAPAAAPPEAGKAAPPPAAGKAPAGK